MTDTKPVSVQARPAEETSTTRFRSRLAEQPSSGIVALPPRAENRIDASTEGSRQLQASPVTADRRESTVIANTMSVYNSVAENPESTDCIADRIGTDLVEVLSSTWQPGSDP